MSQLHQACTYPCKHILDNEISDAIKQLITNKRNTAQVTINNFKAHFLSILASVATDFPLSLWDKLLLQAKITISLLH
ncbi:hypothetical protein ACHAW6_008351 [Cyclotella cf. meneghiniana]